MNNSICHKTVRISDNILKALIYLSAILSVGILIGIIVYVAFRGIGAISWQFLSTVTYEMNNTFGILGNIVNTLYIIVITLIIATPIGIGAAVYRVCQAGENSKAYRVYNRNSIGHTVYNLRSVWYDFLWQDAYAWHIYTLRLSYTYNNGATPYSQNYTGSS